MVFGMIFFLLLRRDEIKKRKWKGKKSTWKNLWEVAIGKINEK